MATPQVLYCCPTPPSADMVQHLHLRGWQLMVVPGNSPCTPGSPAGQSATVGLLWLSEPSLRWLHVMQQCLQGPHAPVDVQWVGALPAQALELTAWRELVINHLHDHQTHPVSCEALDQMLASAHRRANLLALGGSPAPRAEDLGMIGQSQAMNRLRQQIRKMAMADAPVLISGESGSGKELAAQAVHRQSGRADGPFVAVNCGAIAAALIQSELFGHERGSFTGATQGRTGLIEAAAGGTLFLDEIGDLALDLQTNLLRFLQEHTIHKVGSSRPLQVDVRVICATHIDLSQAVAAGRFREDLFYRLSVLPLQVPSLREHPSDIPALARHLLRACLSGLPQARAKGLSEGAVAALMAHAWPGNVRELHNRLRRAAVMADQTLISAADLGLTDAHNESALALETVRNLAEREAIEKALGRVGQNMTYAARLLGVSRMTLYRLKQKHGLADLLAAV
jgi:two-component system response regulator HydG